MVERVDPDILAFLNTMLKCVQECDHTPVEINDKDSQDFRERMINFVYSLDSLHIWLASRRR